jgi:hypothetical protein
MAKPRHCGQSRTVKQAEKVAIGVGFVWQFSDHGECGLYSRGNGMSVVERRVVRGDDKS